MNESKDFYLELTKEYSDTFDVAFLAVCLLYPQSIDGDTCRASFNVKDGNLVGDASNCKSSSMCSRMSVLLKEIINNKIKCQYYNTDKDSTQALRNQIVKVIFPLVNGIPSVFATMIETSIETAKLEIRNALTRIGMTPIPTQTQVQVQQPTGVSVQPQSQPQQQQSQPRAIAQTNFFGGIGGYAIR